MIAVLGATVSFSQKQEGRDTFQLPENEGFRIAPGYSFSASGGGQPALSVTSADRSTRKVIGDVSEALEIINKNYVSITPRTNSELTRSAISAMLKSLDPHSSYFDPAEFQELLDEQQSEYYGIGATIANFERNGEIDTYVLATQPNSPAARVGLKFGDRILEINGKSGSGETSDVVRDLVRGRRGTIVKLKIERAMDLKKQVIEIRRDRVPQPSIRDHYILRPGIGYIDLANGFNYTTITEFDAAMKDLKRQGMSSLILDLRENPGGILDQAVKLAERFIPAGRVIVSQRGRFAIDNRVWKSANKNPETMPIVVLVGENTASASEIVAGALQDYDRALIVGEKTFGKGLVQTVFDLPLSAGLTLTTARYYTPSGRSIQRDYSNGNLYDYFAHRNDGPAASMRRSEARTVTNRPVFGGDGIQPDEVVARREETDDELSLLDPLFFFVRDAVNGRISGLEVPGSAKAVKGTYRIENSEFAVSDMMLDAFIDYAARFDRDRYTAERTRNHVGYVRTRLRYNLAVAAYGTVVAEQILNDDDEQTAKATEALPRAGRLASIASKARITAK